MKGYLLTVTVQKKSNCISDGMPVESSVNKIMFYKLFDMYRYIENYIRLNERELNRPESSININVEKFDIVDYSK